MNRAKPIIIRTIVALLVMLAAWRITSLGLAELYVEKALNGNVTAIDKALSWRANHPKALYLKARQLVQDNPDQAISLLQLSIKHNPADGRAVSELALLLFDKGEIERGDMLAEQAVKLMPSYVPVRLKAAQYWIQREQWSNAMENWELALVTQPSMGSTIYPALLQAAESPESRAILLDAVNDPRPWWGQFFTYATMNAASTETVIALAAMRQASDVKLSASERRDIVRRLMKDQMWPEAYLVWANGLSRAEQRHLGNVYNGSFELAISNEGYDWRIPEIKGVTIGSQVHSGADGDKALHLRFEDREMLFNHLYQPLFLRKGPHEFIVKSKIDFLRSRGGLVWTIHCAGNSKTLLGTSAVLKGAGDWFTVDFRFSVPEDEGCVGQTLRLESTGKHAYDHKLEGDIWFDQVIIRSVRD